MAYTHKTINGIPTFRDVRELMREQELMGWELHNCHQFGGKYDLTFKKYDVLAHRDVIDITPINKEIGVIYG